MNLSFKPLIKIICGNSSFNIGKIPVEETQVKKEALLVIMELNYNKRLQLRKTMVGPVNEESYYLCLSHTEIPVLQGPHIFSCQTLEIAESLAKDYQSKKYQALVTFSYPFEVAAMWDDKKNKNKGKKAK